MLSLYLTYSVDFPTFPVLGNTSMAANDTGLCVYKLQIEKLARTDRFKKRAQDKHRHVLSDDIFKCQSFRCSLFLYENLVMSHSAQHNLSVFERLLCDDTASTYSYRLLEFSFSLAHLLKTELCHLRVDHNSNIAALQRW